MGNDGGSIPTRRELVKEAARNPTTSEIKQTLQERSQHYWKYDPISNQPLSNPVVSDDKGRLFNKESIVEFLIKDEDRGEERNGVKKEAEMVLAGGVRGLKDVVEVRFEVEERGDDGGDEKSNGNGNGEKWICPITRTELGPRTKSIYLVPCGHAFAASIIKEVGEEKKCLVCDEGYAGNDVIPIIPVQEEDVARLALRMKTLREKGLCHSLKKGKKDKKDKSEKKEKKRKHAEDGSKDGEEKQDGEKKVKKEADPEGPKLSNGLKDRATANLTARVMEEQEERNKKRKIETNKNLKTLFHTDDQGKKHANSNDFMTRGFSVPGYTKK